MRTNSYASSILDKCFPGLINDLPESKARIVFLPFFSFLHTTLLLPLMLIKNLENPSVCVQEFLPQRISFFDSGVEISEKQFLKNGAAETLYKEIHGENFRLVFRT